MMLKCGLDRIGEGSLLERQIIKTAGEDWFMQDAVNLWS